MGTQGEDDEAGNTGSECGVACHQSCCVGIICGVHLQGAAWIESIPPEPKEEGAEDAEGNIVSVELAFIFASPAVLAGSDTDDAHERTDCSSEVHNTAASKVHEGGADDGFVAVRQEAFPAPAPIDNCWVDERSHDSGEDHKALELCALGHCTAHNGAACGAEGSLEEPNTEVGFGSEESIHSETGTTDEPVRVFRDTQRKRIAQEVPAQESNRYDDQVLGQDVLGVLDAHTASLEHAKSGVHEEDQQGCKKHPVAPGSR